MDVVARGEWLARSGLLGLLHWVTSNMWPLLLVQLPICCSILEQLLLSVVMTILGVFTHYALPFLWFAVVDDLVLGWCIVSYPCDEENGIWDVIRLGLRFRVPSLVSMVRLALPGRLLL